MGLLTSVNVVSCRRLHWGFSGVRWTDRRNGGQRMDGEAEGEREPGKIAELEKTYQYLTPVNTNT